MEAILESPPRVRGTMKDENDFCVSNHTNKKD